MLIEALGELELEPWTHARVPPNDGGVSLGQTALGLVAAAPSGAAAPHRDAC